VLSAPPRARGRTIGDTIRHELEVAGFDLEQWAAHPTIDREEDQIEGRFLILRHRQALEAWQRYARTQPRRWRMDPPEAS
jgi:hypothetical protein